MLVSFGLMLNEGGGGVGQQLVITVVCDLPRKINEN